MKIGILAVLSLALAPAGTALTPAMSRSAQPRYLETPPNQKPRVVITTDPELDDNNSLIRYLLYSTDYRTEDLIYTSSEFHWKGDGKGTTYSHPNREYNRPGMHICPCTSYRWAPGERYIDDDVEAYAKAYPNLRAHDPDYPAPAYLESKIRWGNVDFEGEMDHDTPGSNLIKSLLLDNEESPVYLHAWGGQNTIARALKSIEDQYKGTPEWPEIRAKVIRKAVIHASGEQDDTYADYIKPNWPEIRYIRQAGGVPLSYNAQNMVSESDAQYYTADWMRKNVSTKGPLGARVRVWGDGKQMVKGDVFDYFGVANESADQLKKQGYVVWTPPRGQGEFLGEGDTATFFNMLDNGLRGYRDDSFGGWGGYLVRDQAAYDAEMRRMMQAFANGGGMAGGAPARHPPQSPSPFVAAAMRDYQARFIWATTPKYKDANHNPRIAMRTPRYIAAKPGQQIKLQATASDPDGNKVALKWWPWKEAGTYAGNLTIPFPDSRNTSFTVPIDAKSGDQIQIIAEATDDGTPPLTRYDKVVITVR